MNELNTIHYSQDVPLVKEVNPDDRRKLLVAQYVTIFKVMKAFFMNLIQKNNLQWCFLFDSMPNIRILNGSEVTHTERDKSERHFVRYFTDKKHKPDRFHELKAKHGTVNFIHPILVAGVVVALDFLRGPTCHMETSSRVCHKIKFSKYMVLVQLLNHVILKVLDTILTL